MRTDRRISKRISLDVDVAVKSDIGFFVGTAQDVSEKGLFVATGRRLPIGGEVALALTLPRGDVVARGHVRWSRDDAEPGETGVGIEFDAIPEEDRARVEAYCADERRTTRGAR